MLVLQGLVSIFSLSCFLFTEYTDFLLVALPDKQAASKVWDRKAAQDDLHEDLQVLQSLSDHMQHVSKKGLSKFYILVAIL